VDAEPGAAPDDLENGAREVADAVVAVAGSAVSLRWAAVTHRGLVRPTNQDAFAVDRGAFVVCDGMGGHSGGETASRIGVETVVALWSDRVPSVTEVVASVAQANDAVLDAARASALLEGMGSTLVLACLADNGGEPTVVCVNLGDSRVYVREDGEVRQLSHDHSVVQELLDEGSISDDEVATHPQRHVVTRALGTDEAPAPDVWVLPLGAGLRLVLTTDGIHGEVPAAEVLEALDLPGPADVCDRLVQAALAVGARDNLTVVVVDVDSPVADGVVLVQDDTLPRSVITAARDMGGSAPQAPRPGLITEVPGA
jgi:protein phosphatase